VAALVLLVLSFGLFWALVVVPQQRRLRRHQELVASIEVGEQVVTSAGIHGTVNDLTDDTALIEVAPGIVMRFARGAIAHRAGDSSSSEGEA
jgi:preprotein translocase subunit YajC